MLENTTKLPKFGNFVVFLGFQTFPIVMGKNTSISIGPHFYSFIQNQIDNGRYASTSEVVRAALRLLEQEEEKLKILRQALVDGEQSGFVENFDPQAFQSSLRREFLS